MGALALPMLSAGQFAGRSTVTVGAGGGFPVSGYLTERVQNSAAFSAGYEFRLFRYVAPEVAVTNLIPTVVNYYKFGTYNTRERVTLVSLGLRGILPLAAGRAEIFAGAGGAHIGSTAYVLSQFGAPWLMQLEAGGRAALDRKHRFWLGTTVRLARDTGRPTEQWVVLTGDFGVRF